MDERSSELVCTTAAGSWRCNRSSTTTSACSRYSSSATTSACGRCGSSASACGTARSTTSTWVEGIRNQLWNHFANLDLNFSGRWNLNIDCIFLDDVFGHRFITRRLNRLDSLCRNIDSKGNVLGLLFCPICDNWIRFLLCLSCVTQDTTRSCSLFVGISDNFAISNALMLFIDLSKEPAQRKLLNTFPSHALELAKLSLIPTNSEHGRAES